jgi:single-stranded DNA-binding protein
MSPTVSISGKAKNVKDLKYTQGGTAVLSFSCVKPIKHGEETQFDWYNFAMFGNQAEVLAGKIVEGTTFHVTGRQELSVYEKQDGTTGVSIKVSVLDFEFIGSKPNDDGEERAVRPKPAGKPAAKKPTVKEAEEDYDPGF